MNGTADNEKAPSEEGAVRKIRLLPDRLNPLRFARGAQFQKERQPAQRGQSKR